MTRHAASRFAAWCAVALLASSLAACNGKEEPMETSTKLVCGLVDASLVAQVVGDGEVTTTGNGAEGAGESTPASCSIRSAQASTPVLQVRIGRTQGDDERWRATLRQEADEAKGVECTTVEEPGDGYYCHYDRGMYNPGTALNVVRDGQVVRLVAYKWSGSTPEQRLDVLRKIAVDASENLAALSR